MDREKEIEGLKQKLFENSKSNYHICGECSIRKCEKDNTPHCGNYQRVAEAVIEAGYGNIEQAVKEFAEKFCDLLWIKCALPKAYTKRLAQEAITACKRPK